MTRSVTLWCLIALVAVVLLQVPPIPGIYLMILGGPLLAGLLVHVVLGALLVESVIGRLPRALVLVPLLAYGGYYVLYFQETAEIDRESVKLRSENPGLTLKFDPARQALVMKGVGEFVESHDLTVAYESSPNTLPVPFASYRRLPKDQCEQARAAWVALPLDARFSIHVKDSNIGDPKNFWATDKNVCTLRLPEKPKGEVVSIVENGPPQWREEPDIQERTLDFVVGGATIATYHMATIRRLPIFPNLFIGCWLNSAAPAWRCSANFIRNRIAIAADRDDAGDATRDDPVGTVLGIARLSGGEKKTAPPAENFGALLAAIRSHQTRVEDARIARDDDLFTTFTRFVQDSSQATVQRGAFSMLVFEGDEKIPEGMTQAIDKAPSRLVPLRDRMVARLSAIDLKKVSFVSPWVALLEHGLQMTPRQDFAAMPDATLDSLLDYLTRKEGWRYGGLYVRTGDAGPRALPFYAKDVGRQGWAADGAAMAVCRIGQADEATRRKLEELYLMSRPKPNMANRENVRTNSAFLVALLRLQDDKFLRENPLVAEGKFVRHWYAMVLDGQGRTEIGPNNCVEMMQHSFGEPPWSAPSIVWEDGDFVVGKER